MRIVLGVGGGIAAYKAAELSRLLTQGSHEVQAVLTRSAQEFITPLTLATLTNRKAITDLFSNISPEATLASAVEHIRVAQENELLVVAPATANLLSRFAHGLADDFLSTLYLAFTGPVLLAPAMNTNMWQHPATQANVEMLRHRGHAFVEPQSGFLACGTTGPGRMAEPVDIAAAVNAIRLSGMTRSEARDLAGEVVLITAGPTREPVDPVRFLSNRSSGKMGYALAAAASDRGARVMLVSGPTSLAAPMGVEFVSVNTAQEMFEAVVARFDEASIAVLSAAVADFHVPHPASQKIKKSDSKLTLELERTPDILSELGCRKGKQLLIGFAAETENLAEEARRKLEAKNCDMVVGNLVSRDDIGFDSEQNEVLAVTRAGSVLLPAASKSVIAHQIFNRVLALKQIPLAHYATE